MQTRPGNEPERDPQEPETGSEAETGSEPESTSESADGAQERERDPFTPKVPPSDDDDDDDDDDDEAEAAAEAPEPAAADLTETVDIRSLPEEPAAEADLAATMDLRSVQQEPASKPDRSHKHRGEKAAESLKPLPAAEEPVAAENSDETAEPEKDAAKTVNLRDLLPESESPEDTAADSGESEPSREQDPSESAAGDLPLRRTPGESGELDQGEPAAGEPPLRRTPGESEPSSQQDQSESAAGEPPLRRSTPPEPGEHDPAVRRRTGEGEPPRRRPAPGGQPARRPGAGQDPRRGGYPHPGEAGGGPRRRPAPGPRPAGAAAAVVAAPTAAPAASVPAKTPSAPSVSLGRRRLFTALWPPRLSRNQAVVGVLLGVLGAALAIQVHATNTSDEILRGARADDLVNILDEVTSRGQSLDAELRTLETQNATIQDSTDKAQAALAQAQQKAKDLQILAGTVKAKGSGITMTITDPQGQLKSATLLNALEELRAAGAEVVQVDNVRVVVSSSFVDAADGGIALDGHPLAQPYVYKVIGDPNTIGPAMQIPGGVVATVKSSPGANATIAPGQVLVDAVVPPPNPSYAKAG